MVKRILFAVICLSFAVSVFVSSTGQTQLTRNNFDDTLTKWLAYVGFKGSVLEYQKLYDDIGYLDYFRILLEEAPGMKANERTQAKIHFEMTDNEAYEFLQIKILEKDIRGIKYMYSDWIARFALSYAIKNVSKLLGLQANTEKVKNNLYKVTIYPAKTTEPSRYRFTSIEAFYEVEDLFLNLDVTIKGEKDYLILSFLKSEVNGVLRALENGNFPGTTSATLISELLRGSSDRLLRDFLKVPEAAHETILRLERNPETKEEELDPAGVF